MKLEKNYYIRLVIFGIHIEGPKKCTQFGRLSTAILKVELKYKIWCVILSQKMVLVTRMPEPPYRMASQKTWRRNSVYILLGSSAYEVSYVKCGGTAYIHRLKDEVTAGWALNSYQSIPVPSYF
jgi:hypothetical protein